MDRQLIKRIQRSSWPSFSQLKYVSRFLNQREKYIISLCAALALLALVTWGISLSIKHSSFVPRDGGEYIEALIGQPKFINPLFAGNNDIDTDLAALIYNGLFRYDSEQKLAPDLAESYTVSDDKKVYEITLRRNISWSDGEPFTANDVLFTFENIQSPEVNSPLFPAFQGVEIEKIDDYKIRFTLKESFAPFLDTLTVGIIPEHVWINVQPANIKLAKNNLQPIGTGPWKFEKLVKDDAGAIQIYSLSRNEKYHGKTPHLKTVTFKFYSDFQQSIEALRSQNVTAVSFIPRPFKEKLAKKNINIYSLTLPQYTALFFNQNQAPPLKDSDLRLALALALDKSAILREALNNEGLIIDSPILQGNIGYYPEIKKNEYNVEKAKKLLDKKWSAIAPEDYFKLRFDSILKGRQAAIDAAAKNPSSTPAMASSTIETIRQEIMATVRQEMRIDQIAYRKNKDSNILSLTITTADTPEYTQAAESIAKMWRALGIKTDIQTISSRQFSREILKGRSYQVLLYGEIVGSDPDLFPFWHSSQIEYPGLNLALFVNRAADKLLEEARVEANGEKRAAGYKKFQDILSKEIPAVFLYTPTYTFAVNKEIKGVAINRVLNPADRYNGLADWYMKTKWVWK